MATFIGTDILTEVSVSLSPRSPTESGMQSETTTVGQAYESVTVEEVESSSSQQYLMMTVDIGTDVSVDSSTTYLPLSSLSSSTYDVAEMSSANMSDHTTLPDEESFDDELLRSVLVGLLASFLAVMIIFGNTLVILVVYRERHLRTVTNLFIVSLACADFLIGSVVLPFSIHAEITRGYWPFGSVWCDLWHAFDILGCTASILNLCMIACDRYWAITHPMSYPTRMTKRTAVFLIGVAWVCSAAISFPCILWWRAIEPPHPPMECIFPSNTVYLITSSCVSFYIPSFIMVFMYLKIYRTAVGQVRALRTGTKLMKCSNGHGNGMAMRVHQGGAIRSVDGTLQKRTGTNSNSFSQQGVKGAVHRKNGAPGKKFMSRLSREHKAARTLGIVMGVFIICWLPFFIVNVTAPVCTSCYFHPILIAFVTWLGYVNSALNPLIYAFASRRFKRAFMRVLCAWKRTKMSTTTSEIGRAGSLACNYPGGVVADTSITQYSDERNSMDTSSSAQSNMKYSLPFIYF
ncbi:dopamine receptor 2-like [Diadema setosum]|uniref:dopamine receptor 2-like n=1 Tax=Diadema setosum TaxID=31175 RepID=UPI003B3B2757